MRRFATLITELDAGADALCALRRYLAAAAPADAAWALHLLAGTRLKALLPASALRAAACQRAAIDEALFDECLRASGDLAETIAQVLPEPVHLSDHGLASWIEQRLLPWRALAPAERVAQLVGTWDELDAAARLVVLRLACGGLRPGLTPLLLQQALAEHAGLDPKLIALRMAAWTADGTPPTAAGFAALVAATPVQAQAAGEPHPFVPARALNAAPETPGSRADWCVQWHYDGPRAQIVRRAGQAWIWSEGGELVTGHFPELAAAAMCLPEGIVLGGEIVVWVEGAAAPASAAMLQRRLARPRPTKKLLADMPAVFMADDLLEQGGMDLRRSPLRERLARLAALLHAGPLRPLPPLHGADWAAVAALRDPAHEQGAAGLRIRALHEGAGEVWFWPAPARRVRAVLVYARPGAAGRAGLLADYGFAVWNRAPADAAEAQAAVDAMVRADHPAPGALQLLPFANTDAGLDDAAITQIDRLIRTQLLLQKWGPVRSVRPALVFELGFDAVHASKRRKSGVEVRNARVLGSCPETPLHAADSLAALVQLMVPS